MIDFFESSRCLSTRLAHYFSDLNAPEVCGHCSVCAGQTATLPQIETAEIDLDRLNKWVSEFSIASKPSISNEALTRMLCGITTPLSTKLKAKKMEGFGQLEQHPFSVVLEKVKAIRKNSVV
ncbi:hypothetical protein BCU12_22290 [Vibrio sp. 10N.261.55.A7]|nr:hypothetical protein BCU12_22290 [Vibrio sp. 10N.261.55.A7]